MMEEKRDVEARVVVLSPNSTLHPKILFKQLVGANLKSPVTVKENCFGLLLEGERGSLEEALKLIRKADEFRIFSKPRGFPPGDCRICRADRGGGPRPGFHQMEMEFNMLPAVGEALSEMKAREAAGRELIKRKIPASEVARLVKEELREF